MKGNFLSRVRIVYIYALFAVLLLVITGFIMYGSYRAEKSIDDMQEITEEYAEGQSAINDLMTASDYLTKQARAFVVTGNKESGLNYQAEIDETRRRDKAVETIKSFKIKKNVYNSLQSALDRSNALTEMEYYAMLLASKGYGLKQSEYKKFTSDAELTKEDEALSDDAKIRKSIDIMFGTEYDEKKADIRADVAASSDQLMEELKERQINSYDTAASLSRNERNMFYFVLCGVFILLILTALLIIRPMSRSTQHINNNEPLPMKGSKEFYCLAEAYNKMLASSKQHQEELSYEATHDELTGLYNRKMFEDERDLLADESVAMLIIDVDHFKEVNDTYGHDTGDMVLKKVGAALTASFRLEDCICRIGGDEFAVIMRQMDSSLKHVVRQKIENVQRKLNMPDDLPHVSLSIGAAFTDDEGPEENIFKKADKALYKIKEHGRDGYAFYGDIKEK